MAELSLANLYSTKANITHTHSGADITSAVNNAVHADTATTADNAVNAVHADTATLADTATTAINVTNVPVAETATKLAVAHSINGVAFDGSADITIDSVNGNTIITTANSQLIPLTWGFTFVLAGANNAVSAPHTLTRNCTIKSFNVVCRSLSGASEIPVNVPIYIFKNGISTGIFATLTAGSANYDITDVICSAGDVIDVRISGNATGLTGLVSVTCNCVNR